MVTVQWSNRAETGLVEPKDIRRDVAPTDGVVVHHGGAGPFKRDDHDDCLEIVAGWQAYHLSEDNPNDYNDLAYNLLACWHELLIEGRSTQTDPIVRGGANGNADINYSAYSLCAVWGSEDGEPPDSLLDTLWQGLQFLRIAAGAGLGVSGHRDHAQTECPGHLYPWVQAGAPRPGTAPVVIDLSLWEPPPTSVELDGDVLTLRFDRPPGSEPELEPEPAPEVPSMPQRPATSLWEPGTRHDSFTAMGERFLIWLGDEISHDGDGYQPGPVFTDWDDFNSRKVQAAMGNAPDPAGEAFLGPKQWARLFEPPPDNVELPAELQGRVPPQLRDDPAPPKPDKVPPRPGNDLWVPGQVHDSFTAMGDRFLGWLREDEIHKAGTVYTPGPRYSVWDDRNVRLIQHLMGNSPDPEGREFLGPQQWRRLFVEDRPGGATAPESLLPGGDGGSVADRLIPVAGRRVTQEFGVKDERYAADEHTGIDYGSDGDDTIRCTGAGTVIYTGYDDDWGNRVVIKHPNGRWSWYCHLASISVTKGGAVTRGGKVGVMGDTGNSDAKHLHYQESVGGWGYWDYTRPTML